MAFSRESTVSPVAIGDITVELLSPDPSGDNQPAVRYFAQLRLSDGTERVLAGNLVPHLTQAQINSLLSFMATLRAKAEAEILP